MINHQLPVISQKQLKLLLPKAKPTFVGSFHVEFSLRRQALQ